MADDHTETVLPGPSLSRILAPLSETEPDGTARVIIDAVLGEDNADGLR